MPTITYPENTDISSIQYLRDYIQSEGFRNRLKYIKNILQRLNYYNSAINHINRDLKIVNTDRSLPNQLKYLGINVLNALTFNSLIDRDYLKTIDQSTRYTSYDPRTLSIYFDISENYNNRIPGTVLAHEYGHIINPSNDIINYHRPHTNAPQEYQDIIYNNDNNIEYNNHDEVYDEKNSDLSATRWALFNTGIFDSRNPKSIFTKDHYKQYKDYLLKNNYKDRLLELLSEDNFIKAVNEIAYNEPKQDSNQLLYAKKGFKLIPRKSFK